IRRALSDPHNAGFLRDDAVLAIVVLAAQDDQSPGTVDEYRAFLRGLKADEDDVMFAVAAPDGMTCGTADAPRLRAIAGDRFSPVCHDGLWQFVCRSACFPTYVPTPCLDDAEVGEHPQCAVWDDGDAYAQCGDGVTGPCWRLDVVPGECGDGYHRFM